MSLVELLQRGRLEQTCPDCGRREAAGATCSWCFRRMIEADQYPNGDTTAHLARLPAAAPANPPVEYRQATRPGRTDGWPSQWGPSPYTKAPQPVASPGKAGAGAAGRLHGGPGQ